MTDKEKLRHLIKTPRIVNSLFFSGVESIEQLTEKTQSDVLRMPNLGRGSLLIIEGALESIGLGLSKPQRPPNVGWVWDPAAWYRAEIENLTGHLVSLEIQKAETERKLEDATAKLAFYEEEAAR